jgi:hypothetical protein
MNKTAKHLSPAAALLAVPLLFATPAPAADLTCNMSFAMKGWSAIYKTAQGSGTVKCSNGQKMKVALESEGGGLTVGKSHIDDGHGDFTGVHDIKDILGDYAAASGEGGISKAGEGTVVTKGDVTLALSGTGSGWNVGVAFSRFTVKPISATAK